MSDVRCALNHQWSFLRPPAPVQINANAPLFTLHLNTNCSKVCTAIFLCIVFCNFRVETQTFLTFVRCYLPGAETRCSGQARWSRSRWRWQWSYIEYYLDNKYWILIDLNCVGCQWMVSGNRTHHSNRINSPNLIPQWNMANYVLVVRNMGRI